MMMKYWAGLSVFPSPISQKLSDRAVRQLVSDIFKTTRIGHRSHVHPENQVG